MSASKQVVLFLALICTGILPAMTARADFNLPYDAYSMDQLAKAQEEAVWRGKHLLILYSNTQTTCGLATQASIDLMEALSETCTIVYASSSKESDDWSKTPAIVRKAINAPEAGKFIPIGVVFDAKITTIKQVIPYHRERESRLIKLSEINRSLAE